MEKQFIPYKTSLKLRELGFYEECLAFYVYQSCDKSERLEIGSDSDYTCETIPAPLYQQVFDWFREKHNIYCIIELYTSTIGSRPGWRTSNWRVGIKYSETSDYVYYLEKESLCKFKNYEECELFAINKITDKWA